MLAGVVCAVGLGGAMLMGIGGGGWRGWSGGGVGVEWGWRGGRRVALHWGCIRRSMKRLLQIFKTKMALHPFNSINKQSLTGHPPCTLRTR